MNFLSIEYFLEVERVRSFSRAAENLYTTQQAVSAKISSLENELGCKLFLRHVPLELTNAGGKFLFYAKKLTNTKQDMENEFKNISKENSGLIKIGLTYTRDYVYMPDIIYTFQKKHPMYTIESISDNVDNIEKKLLSGKIDLGLGTFEDYKKANNTNIDLFFFDEEKLVLLINKKLFESVFHHKVSPNEKFNFYEFDKLPFLLAHPNNLSGKTSKKFFKKYRINPIIKAQSDNIQTLLKLCLNGVGACFCPQNLIEISSIFNNIDELLVINEIDELKYQMYFGILKINPKIKILKDFIEIAVNRTNNF